MRFSGSPSSTAAEALEMALSTSASRSTASPLNGSGTP